MKFRENEHFTEKTNSIAGQTFNINLSAKLFETLFSTMYKYKEDACARELTCNGVDAHSMRDRHYKVIPSYYVALTGITRPPVSKWLAPKGTRMTVHLPDMYEPYFEVKDFGIGLHIDDIIGRPILAREDEVLVDGNIVVKEDEIPEGHSVIGEPGYYEGVLVFRNEDNEIIRSPGLYTTLFNSTKDQSNDQIGAFGLGSKSPFAVSDSFTVESRFDGKLHRFLMYLNASRIPSVDVITKNLDTRDPEPEDTDEYNGLTVNVPIKSSNYQRFSQEISRICRVMEEDAIPEIKSNQYFNQFDRIDRSHRVNNTYIQKGRTGHRGSEHFAVMGGVPYPIDTNQLTSNNRSVIERFPSTYTFFQMGELNVPPSREDLTYDDFARETLNKSFEELTKGLMKEAILDMESCVKHGPIFMHFTKEKYTKLYGPSFGSLVEERWPTDPRISGGVMKMPRMNPQLRKGSRHVKGTYDYPITTSSFFKVTKFDSYQRIELDNFLLSDISGVESEMPLFVIHDDSKSYVQKLKQLTERSGRSVYLLTPEKDLVSYRNAKLGRFYTNYEQMRSEIREWAGTEKTINYLTFADKLFDYYDGLIRNPQVLFMSELPYERLAVTREANLGLVDSCGHNVIAKGKGINNEDVQELIDFGLKLIYVECSGSSITHTIGGELVKPYIEDFYKGMVYLKSKDGKSVASVCGFAPKIFYARKMSMPFLKAHHEHFVPIDEAMKVIFDRVADGLSGAEFGRFAKSKQKISTKLGQLNYFKWILESAESYTNPIREGEKEACDRLEELMVNMPKALELATDADQKWNELYKPFEEEWINVETSLKYFSQCLTPIFKVKGFEADHNQSFGVFEEFEDIADLISDILKINPYFYNKNQNAKRPKGTKRYFWHNRMSNRSYEKYEARKKVRIGIESVLLSKFIKSQYKVKMVGNTDTVIDTIKMQDRLERLTTKLDLDII